MFVKTERRALINRRKDYGLFEDLHQVSGTGKDN
jgi:hypothetical protein